MKRRRHAPWISAVVIASALLWGCTGQEPRGACGDSFCLPRSASLLGKQTPVEDFNLYQVEWRETRFGIYEGNQPQRADEARSTPLRLPIDDSATLYVSEAGGNVLVEIMSECGIGKSCWPQFLDVMGPCRSTADCEVAAFAAELSRRAR